MEKANVEFFKKFFTQMISETPHKDVLGMLAPSEKGDEIDILTSEREKELVLKLEIRKSKYKEKVKQAMMRMEEGTFGDCVECGCEISEARLKARPTAQMCIACKEEEEQKENQTIYGKGKANNVTLINANVFKLKGEDGLASTNADEIMADMDKKGIA